MVSLSNHHHEVAGSEFEKTLISVGGVFQFSLSLEGEGWDEGEISVISGLVNIQGTLPP